MNSSIQVKPTVATYRKIASLTFLSGFQDRDHLCVFIEVISHDENNKLADLTKSPFVLLAQSIKFTGCRLFLNFCKTYFTLVGNNPLSWTEPEGTEHSAIIIRQLIREIQNFIFSDGFSSEALFGEKSDTNNSLSFSAKAEGSANTFENDLPKLVKQAHFSEPYPEEELCHCRAVKTEKVVRAIVFGAKNVDQIARETSAGTSCGNCRSDSQNIIDQLHRKPKLSVL